MPNHTHKTNLRINWYNNAQYGISTTNTSSANLLIDKETIYTSSTGSTSSHSHGNTGYADMVPYYVSVKRWHRTA